VSKIIPGAALYTDATAQAVGAAKNVYDRITDKDTYAPTQEPLTPPPPE
jgi:hypothetical protein